MKHLLAQDIEGADWGRIVAIGEGDNAQVFIKGFDFGFLPYKLVDLGLSVKWADRNLGAASPEDDGFYFQWGDTQGYTAEQCGTGVGQKLFDWQGYKFYENGNITKYDKPNEGVVLDAEDDAAIAETKMKLRMPTQAEMNELFNPENTTMKWVVRTRDNITDPWGEEVELVAEDMNTDGIVYDNGTFNFKEADSTKMFLGVRFYGKGEYASNFIFVPAAGFCGDGSVQGRGNVGYLWSSSLYSDYANGAMGGFFDAYGNFGVDYYGRYSGFSVRAVAGGGQ